MNATSRNGSDFHEGLKYPSPAVKIVALGWFDGPTEGVLQTADGKDFFFKMLDSIADWGQEGIDLRLYELCPLPANSLDRVCLALAPFQAPRWPVWAPQWTFPSREDQQTVEKTVAEVEHAAGPRAWIIASSDLSSEIVAALLEPAAAKTFTD